MADIQILSLIRKEQTNRTTKPLILNENHVTINEASANSASHTN